MPKYLLVLLLFTSSVTHAQTGYKNGTFSIDFGKKKPKQQDTIQQPAAPEDEDSIYVYHKPKKVPKDQNAKPSYDIHELGIFRGLFNAGFTAAQVDGDNEYGYKYLGAAFGAGVMARFHPYISTSLEMNYTMKGARARLPSSDQALRLYMVQWDYIEVPVALNIHYKDLLMFSGGLAPAFMVRYKERNNDGLDVTHDPPAGNPSRFDLSWFVGMHVIIKKHFAIGGKFSYSILKIRDAYSGTRVSGQYNNVFTFRFMYILGSVRRKH